MIIDKEYESELPRMFEHEGEGVAAVALTGLGLDLINVRGQVEEIIGQGMSPVSGHIPFTPRGKKVLELSLREALLLGHNYIGTEHILLGLIREGEGVAAQVLRQRGLELTKVRQAVIQVLSGYQGSDFSGKTFKERKPDDPPPPHLTEAAKTRVEARLSAETPIGAGSGGGGAKISEARIQETEAEVQKAKEELHAAYIAPQGVPDLTERAQETFDVLNAAWVVISILNDHGVQPNPTLVTQLIEWKNG